MNEHSWYCDGHTGTYVWRCRTCPASHSYPGNPPAGPCAGTFRTTEQILEHLQTWGGKRTAFLWDLIAYLNGAKPDFVPDPKEQTILETMVWDALQARLAR